MILIINLFKNIIGYKNIMIFYTLNLKLNLYQKLKKVYKNLLGLLRNLLFCLLKMNVKGLR